MCSSDLLLAIKYANSSELDYYLLLGSAQALGGDLASAVKTLQTAIRIAPERPEPYYRLSLVFLEGYRDQDAGDVLITGLERIPNSSLLLFGLGIVNEAEGKYREAAQYLRKSLEFKYEQPTVWAILGELEDKLSHYDEAVGAYQTAVVQGAPLETFVKYADLLIRLQRFPEAEKLLRQVMARDSRMAKSYVIMGKLYNTQQKYAKAVEVLQRGVEIDPTDPDAHFFLGTALRKLGRVEKARSEFALVSQKKEAGRAAARLLREVLTPVVSTPGTGFAQDPSESR